MQVWNINHRPNLPSGELLASVHFRTFIDGTTNTELRKATSNSSQKYFYIVVSMSYPFSYGTLQYRYYCHHLN